MINKSLKREHKLKKEIKKMSCFIVNTDKFLRNQKESSLSLLIFLTLDACNLALSVSQQRP